MNVLSLFDGCGGTAQALKNIGITPHTYITSETDKYASKISALNHSDIPVFCALGDIKNIDGRALVNMIDLFTAGFPCQDLSRAGKQKGLDGKRSGLFWDAIRLFNVVKPKYFIFENVASMSKSDRLIITSTIGVDPIEINSALLTAQSRKRLYWTNIPGIIQPEDKHIYLKDIIEFGYVDRIKAHCLDANYHKGTHLKHYLEKSRRQIVFNAPIRLDTIKDSSQSNRVYDIRGKSVTLSANGGGGGAKTGLYLIQNPRGKNTGGIKALDGKTPTLTSSSWEYNNLLVQENIIRKLTPEECERLQGFYDGYTQGVSNTQRYKMLGNAFTVPVISHILGFINEEYVYALD